MDLLREELPALQQPQWQDDPKLNDVKFMLAQQDPLVDNRATDNLTAQLGSVARGEAFLNQAGNCAEAFTDSPEHAVELYRKVLIPMSLIMAHIAGVRSVNVVRAAGQFGKPRSSDTEKRGGLVLPSYRGDIVNDEAFSEDARQPNPERLLIAHEHSAATLVAVRRLISSGLPRPIEEYSRDIDFSSHGEYGAKFKTLSEEVAQTLRFMRAWFNVEIDPVSEFFGGGPFVSHEGLILDYEQPQTKLDKNGKLYATSANMLWLGNRTRGIEDAHVDYFSKIENPKGVKLGPDSTPDEVIALCRRLNPNRIPGRLTLISRMGAGQIGNVLPGLMAATREEDESAVWACDPMHGNTFTTEGERKTRRFSDITSEIRSFFGISRDEGVWPGGMHTEVTSEDVTECLGGAEPKSVTDLELNYTSKCDPRLNGPQSLEMAFLVAEMLEETVQRQS